MRNTKLSNALYNWLRGFYLTVQSEENKKSPDPKKIFAISSFELSNGFLQFYDLKGMIKKKSTLVMKIPVEEIDSIESFPNELSVTWNGVTNIFFKKNSSECFSDLRDKIRALLEENQVALQKRQNTDLRQSELLALFKGVVPVIDVCFDVLMLLHEKRPDWPKINQISVNMLHDLPLTWKTLPALSLDFSSFSHAAVTKKPEVVSTEAYSLLWAIHDYFFSLNHQDNAVDAHLDFRNAIVLVDSYFALNDVFLGEVVGDKDNKEEHLFLEESLKVLAEATSFKVDVEALEAGFARFGVEGKNGSAIVDTRAIFKAQLIQLAAKPLT